MVQFSCRKIRLLGGKMYMVTYSAVQYLNGKPNDYGFSEVYDTIEEAEFWAEDWRNGGAIDPEAEIREF